MNRALAIVLVSTLVVQLSEPASADPLLLYGTDFEEPAFTPGPADNQFGLINVFGPNSGVITTDNPSTGAQAMDVDLELLEDFGSGLFASGYTRFLNYADPARPQVVMQVDAFLAGPDTGDGPADDLLSVNFTAYDPSDEAFGAIVLSSNGSLYYTNDPFGDLYQFEVPDVGLGQYHSLTMIVDFALQETSFFLDDEFLASLAFSGLVDPIIFGDASMEVFAFDDPSVIDLDRSLYSVSFDNYLIVAVPAPASLTLTCLGGLTLLGIMRRPRRVDAGPEDRG
jgi:hypothetical protein